MKFCHTCGKELDDPQDPTSRDCGGDCIECKAEAGDPDCIRTLKRIEDAKARDGDRKRGL